MPRTPRKKETKNPVIIEEVKEPETEPEPEVETEQAPGLEQDKETVELENPKKEIRTTNREAIRTIETSTRKSIAK